MEINTWGRQVLLFLVMLLLQIWVFNNIRLFGIAVPLPYIYFILKLPAGTDRNWVLFLAFLLGLFIDMFDYTPGLNALAATGVGFSRFYALKLFSSRDLPDSYVPSISVFGFGMYIRYAISLIIIHQVVLFSVESFSFLDPITLLLRIASSTLLTFVIVLAMEGFRFDFLKK